MSWFRSMCMRVWTSFHLYPYGVKTIHIRRMKLSSERVVTRKRYYFKSRGLKSSFIPPPLFLLPLASYPYHYHFLQPYTLLIVRVSASAVWSSVASLNPLKFSHLFTYWSILQLISQSARSYQGLKMVSLVKCISLIHFCS